MAPTSPAAVLCLASYEKGGDFMRESKRQGWRVILLTMTSLEHGDWPHESIDEVFYMESLSNLDEMIRAVSYLARSRAIERVVPLDDYDVETAAALREHLRLPGMGRTTARYFRDKLAMRDRSASRGVLVPDFAHVLNDEKVHDYTQRVPPPWVLKPRSEVSTIGISKIDSADELWSRVESLGDRRSFHLLERFVPGEVYHVDSIISEREVVFAEAHRYGSPPLEVFHQGGIAISRTVRRDSEDAQALQALNRHVVEALGMVRGVTHAEFIKGRDDGRFYFLEIGARVGGAHTVDLVEAATGINLWVEWAKIEIAQGEEVYHPPPARRDYGAVIISLAKQEEPDTSGYDDPEIVLRIRKKHHVGFVLASPDPDRLEELIGEYRRRFYGDFYTALPPWEERPSAHT
ncbi:MAG: ATP-grasp domain-containing protein [Chloroflexi bacterium]|nr:ATP-grasp domain-containing protein [Chloroflexota bacterium]